MVNWEVMKLEARITRLVGALESYACPGIAACGLEKLHDGTCIQALIGQCGDEARRALDGNQDG